MDIIFNQDPLLFSTKYPHWSWVDYMPEVSIIGELLPLIMNGILRLKNAFLSSICIIVLFQPDQLKEVIDFAIPDEPINLDQLLVDCKDTLKYQVKTGEEEVVVVKVIIM